MWHAVTTATVEGGYTVLLDGKPMRLPGNTSIAVPFAALASAMAAEWAAISGRFTPDDVPLTQLAMTAQGRVRQARDEIITQLVAYGLNDLLCYRAADNPGLAAHEDAAWQPWLDWAARELDVVLRVTYGVTPVSQPEAAAAAFADALAGYDEYQLAGLGVIVPALGSLVLGLAVAKEALGAEEAVQQAQLDEHWQEARWGRDDEAASRRALVCRDVTNAARFMALC
ncbi:MAG: ATPase [Acidocella sp.]|nr:ATPase [Acidocella sp.]